MSIVSQLSQIINPVPGAPTPEQQSNPPNPPQITERRYGTLENYMDHFTTPQEFIRAEVLANRGDKNVVNKSDMLKALGWRADPKDRLDKLTKAQLFDRIVDIYGDQAYSMFPVGVNSICFQIKFGISHKDVLNLAKSGVLTVTGQRKFRKYGKYLYAKVYSAFDYFRLTPEEVQQHLVP